MNKPACKPRAPRSLDDRSRLAVGGKLSGKANIPAMVHGGYSQEYAKRYSARFWNRPEVRAALEAGGAKIREKSMYTVERAMAHAEEVRDKALKAGNFMAACKSVELLSRLAGHLDMTLRVEHVDVRGAFAEARQRTIPWNQYKQIPVINNPFED
jgi:hypothetical protein